METKVCKRCDECKSLTEFSKNKNNNDGLQIYCKSCSKEYKKKYYIEHKGEILKKSKKYYIENQELIITRAKVWSNNNKSKVEQYKKKYVDKHRDFINSKMIMRKKEDPILKLKMLYRSKTNKILGSNRESTFQLIGCSPQELKTHLEKKFKDGMSWENHGLFGWHIDHIIPLSFAKSDDELKKLCHYTNLQPLWAKDNISKRDKIIV
jgi:hypothetical protein